jgi:hypothetical protein
LLKRIEKGEVSGATTQPQLLLVVVALLAVLLLGLASAAIAAGSAPQDSPALTVPPMILPGEATASGSTAGGSTADRWIIGARPGAESRSIARRQGAKVVDPALGIFSTERSGATGLASALRRAGLLVYAEPDVAATSTSYPAFNPDLQPWLNRIVDTVEVTPPPVTVNSPKLGLIEESLNPEHPDLKFANLSGILSLGPIADDHGTAIAAIAGSPADDADGTGSSGIVGVWPGMNMALFPSGTSCTSATQAVLASARAGVAVINMSYGFAFNQCFSHYVATETAVKKGVLPVASAGNDFESGNQPMRPATDPHVVSVSAVDPGDLVAPFATRNPQVDITAPGVGIYAPAIQASTPGGISQLTWGQKDGTSFSAPMVSAAATWLAQARPALDARQIGRLLTSSATDLGAPGRDPLYGEGLLNIGSALSTETPPADPLEPNDDIRWLKGSLLPGKAPYLWRPGRKAAGKTVATLGRSKDPVDVYRVLIAPRRKVLITTAQFQGDVAVKVFRPKAKTVLKSNGQVIVRSDKARPATEGLLVKNTKRRPQTVYVSITVSPRWSDEYVRYRLAVAGR